MPIFQKLQASMSATSIHSTHSHNKDSINSSSSSVSNNIANTGSQHPFELSIDLESPPIILYGLPNESSGSLLSGQLTFTIKPEVFKHDSAKTDINTSTTRPLTKRTHSQNTLHQLSQTLSNLNLSPTTSNNNSPIGSKQNSSSNLLNLLNLKDHILINSVQLCLNQKIHYAKPFLPPSNSLGNCNSCKNKTVELARWDIMAQSKNLPSGKHSYPFSHLLPGNLPATTSLGSSSLTSIKYELVAITSYNNRQNHQTLVKVVLPLNVSRSILRGPDRNSLRVFPPTDVTATAVLPNVIYPKSSFALELRLDGVSTEDKRWRMRRVGWRIEEQVKVKANACVNHKTKLKLVEEQVKKNQEIHRPLVVKRNRQSGPTSSMILANNLPALEPSQSRNEENNNNEANDNDDTISVHTENSHLHPSDHANEEIRQQAQSQQLRDEELRRRNEVSLYCEEIRTIASGDLRNGWKSDFTGKGKIELIADISCFNLSSAAGMHYTNASTTKPVDLPMIHPTVSCDIDDPVLGISASHTLIVEVVIAEEVLQTPTHNSLTPSSSHKSVKTDQRLAELSPIYANHSQPTTSNSNGQPNNESASSLAPVSSNKSDSIPSSVGVPTGSARVLRMQFKLYVTERSGLGIAWDDEVPPMYDDVSALSPPTYDKSVDRPHEEGEIDNGENPPLYPLNLAPAHTHTHLNGTPGVLYGIGATPNMTPRPSGNYQSLNGALENDEFQL